VLYVWVGVCMCELLGVCFRLFLVLFILHGFY
jgi:hypothetical protein